MDPVTTSVRGLSSAGGQVLRAATRTVAALRPAAKPLHPRGTVGPATLRRFGSDERSGAAWLDGPGEDEVLARRSRAVGLPGPVPDIFGLALRVPVGDGRYGDLLLASTGLGQLTRFTLTAGREPHSRPMTTLLPYRSPSGPVLVCAVWRDDDSLDLFWGRATGPWHRFADLCLGTEPVADQDASVSFDPLHNTLPGLENYGWGRRLREPSYLTARRSRHAE
ncbi:MAG TPA: hypothetical protein VLA97_14460 [Nocardioidaceae bacterium]|nr:hypothetical protein [Nocardioidaceae bacterium]